MGGKQDEEGPIFLRNNCPFTPLDESLKQRLKSQIIADSSKAVRREVSISDTSLSWKKQQPEYKIWHTKQKSTDGNSQAAERDGRNISIKDGASGYTGELVEHTLLSSSVHYGGRDNFESSTTRTYAGTPTIFGNNSGEDVSDGGSPRGNWWQGSYYY
ncbi:uncharacterized protein [Aristolochia californica]|uniref:uncharacterized protein isoform X2 n=1 Tax=Aristolochia californica TaxID=171875 RepID=UPI0035DDAB8C